VCVCVCVCVCPAAAVIYVHLCVLAWGRPTANGSAHRSGRTEVLMVDSDISDESAAP
jgi:hypothetical protein